MFQRLAVAQRVDQVGDDLAQRCTIAEFQPDRQVAGSDDVESTVLRAPGLPPAVIRDQKPMKFIAEKIDPDSSLSEYLTAINSASSSGPPLRDWTGCATRRSTAPRTR